MNYLNFILVTLISNMQNFGQNGIILNDSLSVTIILDELESNGIPDDFWKKAQNITELKIQKTRPQGNWVTYPPLKWYESREHKPPFWQLPDKISELKNLKALSLIDLELGELPNSIIELEKLEVLDISLNKLLLYKECLKLSELKSLKLLKAPGNLYNDEEMKNFKEAYPRITIKYKGKDFE